MALRVAKAYSKRYTRPYTRKSKVKSKSYIKSVPDAKVVKLKMGDVEGWENGRFKTILKIVSKDKIQLRDNAIESVRQYIHRFMTELVGKDYFFEVNVYPHHILRENKMITGAGADRMQTGMALSFGGTMGRAALVKANQTLFTVGVASLKSEQIARKLIASSKAKLPSGIRIDTTYLK